MRCLREGQVLGLAEHTVLVNRRGQEIAIQDSAAPIRDRAGNLIGAVMVFHDVSKERRLHRALHYPVSYTHLDVYKRQPDYLATKYADLTDELLAEVEARAGQWGGARLGRILGDCHRGNILWTDAGPHFVDLDDCLTGPAIQDLWMLLAGSQQEMRVEMRDLLAGYEQFLAFDRRELALIEPLRALRMIHYSAWLARRWHDPAFPKAFPWFAEPRYWEEHYRALEEQLGAVVAPPLEL